MTTIQNADKIYVLDNGSVIEEGTHYTLMEKENGKYKTMVKSQQVEKLDDHTKDDFKSMEKIEEDEKDICMLII